MASENRNPEGGGHKPSGACRGTVRDGAGQDDPTLDRSPVGRSSSETINELERRPTPGATTQKRGADPDAVSTQKIELVADPRALRNPVVDNDAATEVARAWGTDPRPLRESEPRATSEKPAGRRLARPTIDHEAASLPFDMGPLGTVPRDLLGKWGTDGFGAAAHRAAIDRREEALPHVSIPALRRLRGELSGEALRNLERTLTGELEDDARDPMLSPKRALESLVHEPHLYDLSLAESAHILASIARNPRDIATIRAALTLIKSGAPRRLRPADREHLLATFDALESEERLLLVRLTARPLRTGSVIEDRDFENISLVARIRELTTQIELAPALEGAQIDRRMIVRHLLSTLVHPERLPLEDGPDGVFSLLEFALADSSPAELVRLTSGCTTGHQSVRLAGDGQLDLGARLLRDGHEILFGEAAPIRLALEHLVSAARSPNRSRVSPFSMIGGEGLDVGLIAEVLSSLYGVGYTVAAGAPAALRHLERANRSTRRVPPVFVTVLYPGGERAFVFDHLTHTDVYVRGSHGKSSKAKGQVRLEPERFVADPEHGLDRIPRPAFLEAVGVALIPR